MRAWICTHCTGRQYPCCRAEGAVLTDRGLLQVTKVVIPPAKPDKPNREFGFIHFAEKDTVDKLISGAEQGTKPEMDGKTLEVSSRPASISMAHQHALSGVPPGVEHLCVLVRLSGDNRL